MLQLGLCSTKQGADLQPESGAPTCRAAGVQALAQEAAHRLRERRVVLECVQLLGHRVGQQQEDLLGCRQRPPEAPRRRQLLGDTRARIVIIPLSPGFLDVCIVTVLSDPGSVLTSPTKAHQQVLQGEGAGRR